MAGEQLGGLPSVTSENPLLPKKKKTISEEMAEVRALVNNIDSLASLHDQLNRVRENTKVTERIADIAYIRKIDDYVESVLDSLATPELQGKMKTAILKIVEEGNFGKLSALLASFGIAMETREKLLGYDDTRVMGQQKQKKLKLQVVWEGEDGKKMGAQAEVSE